MTEFGGALDNWLNKDNPYENECPYCIDEDECLCDEENFREPDEPEEREYYG